MAHRLELADNAGPRYVTSIFPGIELCELADNAGPGHVTSILPLLEPYELADNAGPGHVASILPLLEPYRSSNSCTSKAVSAARMLEAGCHHPLFALIHAVQSFTTKH